MIKTTIPRYENFITGGKQRLWAAIYMFRIAWLPCNVTGERSKSYSEFNYWHDSKWHTKSIHLSASEVCYCNYLFLVEYVLTSYTSYVNQIHLSHHVTCDFRQARNWRVSINNFIVEAIMGKAGKKLVEKTKVEKYLKQAKCASAFPGKLYRLLTYSLWLKCKHGWTIARNIKWRMKFTYQLLFPYFNGEAVISLGLDK